MFLSQITASYFRFKRAFEMLKGYEITALSFPFFEGKLAEKSFEIVELCKHLQKQQFIRGDYKELVNLFLLYLTGGNEHGSNMLNHD